MKLGILSDSHDHIKNTEKALEIFRQHKAERLMHCGDLTSPQIVRLFAGWDISFVFGNVDLGHAEMIQAAKDQLGTPAIGYTFTANWGGVRIAACHGNNILQLKTFIHSGDYDYVFHGHSHIRRDDKIEETRVINPGSLGGKHPQSRSVCMLDTDTGETTFIEIKP